MPELDIASQLTSDIVELQNTDSARQKFYVHRALLNAQCRPLQQSVREYWKEFDAQTVGRLAQYLYQADYSFPKPIPLQPTTPHGSDGGESHTSTWCADKNTMPLPIARTPPPPPKYSSERPLPTRPLTPLEKFHIPKLYKVPKEPTPKPQSNSSTTTTLDFELVLLSHATLYILSRSQGMNALSDLCITRLHETLLNINPLQPSTPAIGNTVKLLRYAYSYNSKSPPTNPILSAWVQLQDLVTQFCALNIETLEKDEDFQDLLREPGLLASDVMAKIVRIVRANKNFWGFLSAGSGRFIFLH